MKFGSFLPPPPIIKFFQWKISKIVQNGLIGKRNFVSQQEVNFYWNSFRLDKTFFTVKFDCDHVRINSFCLSKQEAVDCLIKNVGLHKEK